jgi:hypothetical protein
MSKPTYNFSSIPGFNDIIQSDNITATNILKLNKVESRTSNNTVYKIIRYDKNFLTNDLIHNYGLCRSVIVNSNGKVVGFAPPKSMPCDDFIKKYSEIKSEIVAQEFIEGTMINIFWDNSIGINGGWEISTRNTVGATSSFYKGPKTKNFRDMFLEASKSCGLLLDNLEKENCYSFVLQHPENRIVVPFKKSQLYLVAVYSIHNEQDNISVTVNDVNDFVDVFHALNTTVQFPRIYKFEKYSELIDKYASMNTSYNILGVVLYNKITGERSKIRNPVYEQIRNLRGNQPKLQYQYLSLRKEGKVGEFLKFYPENKKEFSAYRDQLHLFTETLFSNYISCYIKKAKPLILFTDQYRTHMFNLHKKYLNELKEQKLFITSAIVKKYVNELPSSLLMYCLNFQMRKRNVAAIVSQGEMEIELEIEPDITIVVDEDKMDEE